MFDNISKKLAEKMGRSVKEAAEPIRSEMKKAANNKVDLYSKILRLGVLVLLFIDGTRRVANLDSDKTESGPSQIVINNYMQTPPSSRRKPTPGKGR